MPTSPHSAPRIFVSHSQVDNDFGVRLVDDLRQILGVEGSVWYDAHGGLHGGDFWWPKITSELKACNVFIVVLSPEAVSSRWVIDEINLAWLQRNKAGMLIIPIIYRKCKIPEYLNIVQIISFLSPRTYEEAFNKLLEALGLATQPVSPLPRPIPILSRISNIGSSAIKRVSSISRERIVQIAALLIIVANIVFSSMWWNQGITTVASQAAMAVAITTHYPFSSHEALYDPLTNTSQHNKVRWDTKAGCQFTDQGYMVMESDTRYFNTCFAGNTNFKNFTYAVTMTIIQGDCGALLFRANARQADFYLFYLCQNGYYFLIIYGDKFGQLGKALTNVPLPSGFNVGLNHPISIGIVARASTISLYINGVFIDHIIDNAYSEGQIGVAAYPLPQGKPTEVIFSNAAVWLL